jgi:hypothetical protein
MALLILDRVQNVSIDAALRHLTLAEKVADVNPTDLDPKTRSVSHIKTHVIHFCTAEFQILIKYATFE